MRGVEMNIWDYLRVFGTAGYGPCLASGQPRTRGIDSLRLWLDFVETETQEGA